MISRVLSSDIGSAFRQKTAWPPPSMQGACGKAEQLRTAGPIELFDGNPAYVGTFRAGINPAPTFPPLRLILRRVG